MTGEQILNANKTYEQLENTLGLQINQLEGYIDALGYGILTVSDIYTGARIARIEAEFDMFTGNLINAEILKNF